MNVVIDSLLINYIDVGKGSNVLLLHGWGDQATTFQQLIDHLSAQYRVIAPDLPGFGQSQPPHEPWNLDNYAYLVHDFLAKVDAAEPEAIVGHSNGGAVAIRGLSLGTLKTKKLVLLASAGVRNTKKVRRTLIMIVAKMGKLLTFWLPKSMRRKLQQKLYGTIGSDALVTPTLRETFALTVRQDIQSDARTLKVPTLLIYGNNDKATSVKTIGTKLAGLIEGSKLETVPEAGHFVHHDRPDVVNQQVEAFLKS